MQAMLARVTEPVAYQAFQHFITHAPWDADRIWRRVRQVIPERRGVLILDGTSFPKHGTQSVGTARQDLWGLGEDRQLPSRDHGGALDRRTGLVPGRDLVSPRRVAHARRTTTRTDSGRGHVSRKMAARAHPVASSTGRGFPSDGRGRRCRIWRRVGRPHGLASPAAAICARDFVRSDRVPAAPLFATPSAAALRPPLDPRPSRSAATGRGGDRRGRVAAEGMTHDLLAQWRQPIPTRPVCRGPRDARAWLASGHPRPRRVVVVRARRGPHGSTSLLLRALARRPVLASAGPVGASALGHRTAISRAQERARPRSFRGANVSRLAAPRRPDRRLPRVHSARTDAPWRRRTDVSSRARHRAGNLYGVAVCGETALHALDGRSETRTPTTDLTKSN